MENTYVIEGTEYEIYQAASRDFCVEVREYGKENAQYNCGSYEKALAFILSRYEAC